METYLYGDSTLSPFQHDFIAFLPEAIDFIVQALLCDSRIDDALQRAAQLTERTAKEIEDAQTMLVEAAGPLERRISIESDSLAARCGAQARRNMSELVHAEIERAQAAVAAETARAEQTAAGERAAFAKAFDSLVLRRVLVDATEGVEVSADTGRYTARRRASTSYGLRWIAKIDIPTSHPLGRILRLERLIDRIEVEAPEPAGWLHKELKVRTQRLDRLHLTELMVTADETTVRLRASAEGTGGGFDLTFGRDPTHVQIVRVSESGLPDAPYETAPSDSDTLHDLQAKLRALVGDLLEHETAVVAATLDDRPLLQLPAPRALVDRLIATMAPLVQEIARRSLVPGELVLKRQVAENQREELFVSKAKLRKKIESLPPELQRALEPLGLGGPLQPTAEPFALLREPGESSAPISAPTVSVPAAGGTSVPAATKPGAGACANTQPRLSNGIDASDSGRDGLVTTTVDVKLP
jgi:hypothetical protein